MVYWVKERHVGVLGDFVAGSKVGETLEYARFNCFEDMRWMCTIVVRILDLFTFFVKHIEGKLIKTVPVHFHIQKWKKIGFSNRYLVMNRTVLFVGAPDANSKL